jgi:hydrogenase 3 maturation protease
VSDSLIELLKQSDRKFLFVGIGNVLKQDDGIGVYISSRLKEEENVRVLTAEVSIENYIGKINSIEYDNLIIIDCVDIRKQPGSYMLLPANQVMDMTFNTHNISLKKLSEFFKNEVYVLAIQPEKVAFVELINKQGGKNGS